MRQTISNVAINLHDALHVASMEHAPAVCKEYFEEHVEWCNSLDESDFLWAVQWGMFDGDEVKACQWCVEHVLPMFDAWAEYCH